MTKNNKANEIVSQEPVDEPCEELSPLEKHKKEVKEALDEARELTSLKRNNKKLDWHIRSLCPLDVNFVLPVGLAKDSETITQILEMIEKTDSSISLPDKKSEKQKDAFANAHYLNVGSDTSTIRLFTWTHSIEGVVVQFHVFPNRLAVAEIKLPALYDNDPKSLDDSVLQITNALIGQAYEHFKKLLTKLFEDQEQDKSNEDERASDTTIKQLSLSERTDNFEQIILIEALHRHQGMLKEVQQELQVSRKTLYDKLRKHQLDKTDFKNR